MARFHKVGVRARRSEEVLVFGRIPRERVRILRPSTRGRPCRAWPLDAADTGASGYAFEARAREAGVRLQPGAWAPRLRGREIGPDALRPVQAVGGANDGLSLVDVDGRQFLLKRARPNVEDDEMLTAGAMRAQLRACWAAHAIRRAFAAAAAAIADADEEGSGAGGGGGAPATPPTGVDPGCCLYEYEAFFEDFRDPDREAFTWPDEGAGQVWPGSFLLFRWPGPGDPPPRAAAGPLAGALGVLADCVLGVPHSAERRALDKLGDGALGELTEAQRELVLDVMTLDRALGCPSVERAQRDDGFVRGEGALELLRAALESAGGGVVDGVLRAHGLQDALLRGLSQGLAKRACAVAALLDLQPFRAEVHTKHATTYEKCIGARLELLREAGRRMLSGTGRSESQPDPSSHTQRSESAGSFSSRANCRGFSLGGLSREFSLDVMTENPLASLLRGIECALDQACNRCAILFTEPLSTSDARVGGACLLGRNCAGSHLLKHQIVSSPSLMGRLEARVEVATHYSLVGAALNHSIVFLQTRVELIEASSEPADKSIGLKVCLESELYDERGEFYNAQWYQLIRRTTDDTKIASDGTNSSDGHLLEQLRKSDLKLLFLLDFNDADGSEDIGDHPQGAIETEVEELDYYVVLLQGAEEPICKFCVQFCEALIDDKSPHEAFSICLPACGPVTTRIFIPADRKEISFQMRKGLKVELNPSSQAMTLDLKICNAKYNAIIREIVQRIQKAHFHSKHLFFEDLLMHLDAFVHWHADREGHQVSGYGVEILNIFGPSGDSSTSELALELAQYCFFRPWIFHVVSQKRTIESPRDLIFQLDAGTTENDLISQVQFDNEEDNLNQIIIIDARKMKSGQLQKVFSFPSEFLNFAGEHGLQVILFHSPERCGPKTWSCIHYPRGPLAHWSRHIAPAFAETGVVLPKFQSKDFQPVFKHARVQFEFHSQHSFHRLTTLRGSTDREGSKQLLNYLLGLGLVDPKTNEETVSVVKDGRWCDAADLLKWCIAEKCIESARESDDQSAKLLQQVIDILMNCAEESVSSSSILFQVLRPIAHLPLHHVQGLLHYLQTNLEGRAGTAMTELLVRKLFDLLGMDLQQALVFFSMLPEGVRLDGADGLLSMDILNREGNLDRQSVLGTAAESAPEHRSFWKDCWLSALSFETSDSGTFHRLGGRFPGQESRETCLFQWLLEKGLISEPPTDKKGIKSLFQTLVKKGFIVSDGSTFLVPSKLRVFCETLMLHFRQSQRYAKAVQTLQLAVVDQLLRTFNSQQSLESCSRLLIKHISVWTWALDTLTSSAQTGTPPTTNCKLSLRVARLLWSVRRSVRAFYEPESEEHGDTDEERLDRNWRKQIVHWSGIAAEELCPSKTKCESLENTIAAAMCWYMQTYAFHGQKNHAAAASCERALWAIKRAEEQCSVSGVLESEPLFCLCSICHAEILALMGRIKSDSYSIPEVRDENRREAIVILTVALQRVEQLEGLVPRWGASQASIGLEKEEDFANSVIRLESALSFPNLKCEVLNSLGNVNRVLAKSSDDSLLTKAVEYYQQAAKALNLPENEPNFVSHNIGLSLLKQSEALSLKLCAIQSQGRQINERTISKDVIKEFMNNKKTIELLKSARLHLRQSVRFRTEAVQSKSFSSVLRLCDSYRTLDTVLFYLQGSTSDEVSEEIARGTVKHSLAYSADSAPLSPSPECDSGAWLLRGRIGALGRLRRCARTWEDRTRALDRLCMWMRYAGPFIVPEYAENGRRRVLIQWRGPKGGLNDALLRLSEPGSSASAELAREMLRTLTGLRLDAGATAHLALTVDPVVDCVCDLAAKCVARLLGPAEFCQAVAALRALVRGSDGEGAGAWARQWRARVASTVRHFARSAGGVRSSASPLANPAFTPAVALLSPTNSEGHCDATEAGGPVMVAEPSLYVARLVLLLDEDLSRDEQYEVLHAGLAAVSGWAAVLHWDNCRSGGDSTPKQSVSRGKGPAGKKESGQIDRPLSVSRADRDGEGLNGDGGSGAQESVWEIWQRRRSEDAMYRELLLVWLAVTAVPVRVFRGGWAGRDLLFGNGERLLLLLLLSPRIPAFFDNHSSY